MWLHVANKPYWGAAKLDMQNSNVFFTADACACKSELAHLPAGCCQQAGQPFPET